MTANASHSAIQKTINAMQISRDPAKFFIEKLAQNEPGFFLSMPGLNQVLMATSASGAKEVIQSPSTVLTSSLPSPLEPLLGKWSLILLQGDQHTQERKMLKPAFQGGCLRAYVPLMQVVIDNEFESLESDALVDVQALMNDITLNIIIEVVFGISAAERRVLYQQAIRHVLRKFTPMLMLMPGSRKHCLGLSPWDRFVEAKQQFEELLLEDIHKVRAQKEPSADILSTLVHLKSESGESLSDEHLLDQLLTLLAAGHETTANTLSWAVYKVASSPTVQQQLMAELEPIALDASIDDIMKLRYLDAVLKEVLRMYPVVPLVMRSVIAPCELMGHKVEKGTYAGVATYSLHMNPDIWEAPQEFEPNRFLQRDYTPFEFVPFGGGNKKCLGYGFALFEMKLVLFKLFKQFSVSINTSQGIKPAIQGITLGPKQKIHAAFNRC